MTDTIYVDAPLVSARDTYCRYGYYGTYSNRCRSSWDYYGRWILAAILLGLCLLFFFLWA